MRYLLFIFSLLFFVSCKHDIKPFPAREIYYSFKGIDGCYMSHVISDYPIILGSAMKLTEDECPDVVMGISKDKITEVRDWVKDTQEKASKNCQ